MTADGAASAARGSAAALTFTPQLTPSVCTALAATLPARVALRGARSVGAAWQTWVSRQGCQPAPRSTQHPPLHCGRALSRKCNRHALEICPPLHLPALPFPPAGALLRPADVRGAAVAPGGRRGSRHCADLAATLPHTQDRAEGAEACCAVVEGAQQQACRMCNPSVPAGAFKKPQQRSPCTHVLSCSLAPTPWPRPSPPALPAGLAARTQPAGGRLLLRCCADGPAAPCAQRGTDAAATGGHAADRFRAVAARRCRSSRPAGQPAGQRRTI